MMDNLTATPVGGTMTVIGADGHTYLLEVITITRNGITESFESDVKKLQQLLRDETKIASQHFDRLVKCRRQKRALVALMKAMENSMSRVDD